VYTRNRSSGIQNGNLNSAIGEELTMPYSNHCRSANVLMLSLFGILLPFTAALAGDPQETAPLVTIKLNPLLSCKRTRRSEYPSMCT